MLGEQGAIAFHDRHIVRAGIEEFVSELDPGSFTAYPLPGSVFVVELGEPRLVCSEWVAGLVPEPGEELVPPRSAD